MNHLSNHVKSIGSAAFKNVDVVENPSKHSVLGDRDDVLYLNIEPYTRAITSPYEHVIIMKIITEKRAIFAAFPGKTVIVIDDLLKLKK